LQGVISPAITEGIANNKEKMIDALYPIMGGMISKYVTRAIKEMMETINRKIEQGFSVERYKRKIKAKLTGVSESELLLEESTDAHIEAMFIIHKETGLLISEAHLEQSSITDVHMVASMASAIKDFINDWIAGNKEAQNEEIQILSYGTATLYIESAGSVYLIAFLDSEPDHEQRAQINAFFASLLEKYADFFQHFDGDESAAEVFELSEKMLHYLVTHDTHNDIDMHASKKGNPAKMIMLGIGMAILVYAGYTIKGMYEREQLVKEIAYKTSEEVVVEKEGDHIVLRGLLDDMSHLAAIRAIVKEYLPQKKSVMHLGLSVEGVEALTSRYAEEMARKVAQDKQTIMKDNTAKMEGLASTVKRYRQESDARIKHLEAVYRKQQALLQMHQEIGDPAQMRMLIAKRLQKVLGDTPYYDPQKAILNFSGLHLFGAGETEPDAQKMRTVTSVFERYLIGIKPYVSYISHLSILSYSDSSGSEKENLMLTQQRAKMIKKYLDETMISSGMSDGDLLIAEGMGERDPVLIEGVGDQETSRRIIIEFALDKKKIEMQIKKIEERILEIEENNKYPMQYDLKERAQ